MERWRMMDPFEVVARMERQKQRQYEKDREQHGVIMTDDQSAQIEDLLTVWYLYEDRYRVALGAPKVSVSCRDHMPERGDTHATGADRDEVLEKVTAEQVGACVDELHYLQQAAIGVHMRNKVGRQAVHRNPRIQDQHKAYQGAKEAIFPKLRKKGLVR